MEENDFPGRDLVESLLKGKTFAWRGRLVYWFRVLPTGKVRFLARDRDRVVCYVSEEGMVSYPGDALPAAVSCGGDALKPKDESPVV